MSTQEKGISRGDAAIAANAEIDIKGLKRRGFFAAIAATVVGAFGVRKIFPNVATHQQILTSEKPVVSVHPNAIARTEEGSKRHG